MWHSVLKFMLTYQLQSIVQTIRKQLINQNVLRCIHFWGTIQ